MKALVLRVILTKGGGIGLVILIAVIVMAASARWVFPFSPWDITGAPFEPPLSEHLLLGSDMLGRDIAAGIAHGAYVSLLIGVVSTVVALAVGITLGAISGYAGGWVDQLLMGLVEFFQTIPSFVLAIVLVAIFNPSIVAIVGAIAVVSWPPIARLVRAEVMSLRSREFVQAAWLAGRSNAAIVFKEILPNALSPIVVAGSMMVATAILLESALSFLGLGDPNLMSWGYIIGASRTVMRQAWWMSVFPGLAIVLTVLAINLIGEALNDALNPHLRPVEEAT
jgi:peptide/nickel transport system permease protein